MDYPLTHTTPDLKINPTKEDIVESLTPFGNLTEYFGAASNHIKTFFGIDDFEPPKTNTEKIKKVALPARRKTEESAPPINTIEGLKKYSVDIDPVDNIHSLTPEHVSTGRDIIGFFMNKGLSKEQAAGIAGNLYAESTFRPAVWDKGKISFGLAQWTNQRLKSLKKYAKQNNKPIADVGTQLEFIWKELNTTEKNALNHLLQTTNASDAAKSFANKFERMKVYNNVRHEVADMLYNIK